MAVPGLDLGRVKWKDNHDTQSISARPTLSYEDMGYTNVIRNGGAVTTRCKRSMGWETPTNIDDNLLPEFAMLRVIKTPSPVQLAARAAAFAASTHNFTEQFRPDPWGSRAGVRRTICQEFGVAPMRTAVESKAYINQLQRNCPYAADRRYLAGEWLYKSSVLHKSEPIADKNYLTVYEKRPLTQSRKPGPFSGTRSTRQCVALIHQHMNDRSKTSKTASRMVDCKHPLRALMKADVGNKGYLTHEELKECLQRNFEVLLDYDEIERVTGQFESDIPAPDGMNGFNYMAFVKSMNNMSQDHPLGGYAGSSWGYKSAPPVAYDKVR